MLLPKSDDLSMMPGAHVETQTQWCTSVTRALFHPSSGMGGELGQQLGILTDQTTWSMQCNGAETEEGRCLKNKAKGKN